MCENETDELFQLGDDEVCEECLFLYAEEKKCDRCGNVAFDTLYNYNGECVCERCLKKATKIEMVEE